MANTYSQIYLHIIFAVKNRQSLIAEADLPRIHAYMGGILREHGHIPLAIGGIGNHVHLLIRYNPAERIPDMMRDLKSGATRYINDNHLSAGWFEWQAGYGCFSYSQSHVHPVVEYIRNQKEHHRSINFSDEFRSILQKFEVEYDQRFILTDPE